jgi:hypothetical protein
MDSAQSELVIIACVRMNTQSILKYFLLHCNPDSYEPKDRALRRTENGREKHDHEHVNQNSQSIIRLRKLSVILVTDTLWKQRAVIARSI